MTARPKTARATSAPATTVHRGQRAPLLTSALALLLLATGCATTMPSRDPARLNDEIRQFLADYAAAYNQQDYATLLSYWDRSDENPIYIAEEIDPPIRGWKKVNAYFARPGVLDGLRNEYTDVNAHYLADDLAIATYRLRFDIQVKGMKPLTSWDRVVAVFRQREGAWKLTAYAEAPMAPLTMVRRMARQSDLPPDEQRRLLDAIRTLQEEAVPEDFGAWLQTPAARTPANDGRP